MKSKDKWQNGNQKTHRTDCEQSRKMKERLRIVKCTQRHRKINEATEAQVKEAAGTHSKKLVDGDFPTCKRHKKDNNDDNTRKNEDLKGKGGGRLNHCKRRWRCATVSEKN